MMPLEQLESVINTLVETTQPSISNLEEESEERNHYESEGLKQAQLKLQECLFWLELSKQDFQSFKISDSAEEN